MLSAELPSLGLPTWNLKRQPLKYIILRTSRLNFSLEANLATGSVQQRCNFSRFPPPPPRLFGSFMQGCGVGHIMFGASPAAMLVGGGSPYKRESTEEIKDCGRRGQWFIFRFSKARFTGPGCNWRGFQVAFKQLKKTLGPETQREGGGLLLHY